MISLHLVLQQVDHKDWVMDFFPAQLLASSKDNLLLKVDVERWTGSRRRCAMPTLLPGAYREPRINKLYLINRVTFSPPNPPGS